MAVSSDRPGRVVIASDERDLHAIAVRKSLTEDFGVPCDIVDLSRFPAKSRLRIGIEAEQETLQWESAPRIDWHAVTAVWWRRPRRPSLPDNSLDRQAKAFAVAECDGAVSALLLASTARFVNQPARQTAASHKGYQLVLARRTGLGIPRTLISNDPAAVREFMASMKGDCITKPLTHPAERMLPTRPFTRDDLEQLQRLALGPILVQQALSFGADVRVSIFGNEVFAASTPVDQYDGRLDLEALWRPTELPKSIIDKLLALKNDLGLAMGVFDLRKTPEGEYYFLEINPAGQFLFIERDTGQPLVSSLCRLLTG